MSKRRMGKFSIPEAVLREPDTSQILAMMEFVPLRAEMMAHSMEVEYQGLSPMFDEIDLGDLIPEYVIVCHKDDDGLVDNVEAQRQ